MKNSMIRFLWGAFPKKTMSKLMGMFARHKISKKMIPWYIRKFAIDMSPVKKDISEFNTLLDFFIRELHDDARPIYSSVDHIVSPVDGSVVQIGDVKDDMLIQAKGMTYSLSTLLGEKEHTKRFRQGKFVTLYLSPKDYHRIHMPVTGRIRELTYIPGQLYPVNNIGLQFIPGLFQRNERVITYIESIAGQVAVVKVGATNVGSIKVDFDHAVRSNKRKSVQRRKVYQEEISLDKGQEMGRFEFGSTVILLFESNKVEWTIPADVGTYVQMGQSIAKVKDKK